MRYSATVVLAMAGVALAGCAGADGLFDRYTLTEYGYRPPANNYRVPQPSGGIEAGRYAGATRLIAQSGACPPDTGVLTVSRGAVRYSDAANGMIDGVVGPGGRVDIRHGSIRLEGRLAASRFAGTISGGRCAYDLALRHGGVSIPSALGVPHAVAGVATPRPVIAPPPAPGDVAAPDADALSDEDYSRQARFAALLAQLRASRAARHPAPDDATAPVASEALPAPAAGAPTAPPAATASAAAPASAGVGAPAAAATVARSTAQAIEPQAASNQALAGQHAASPAQQAGQLLAQGRIAAARPLYERAAASGDAAAATAVGKTYDPLFLANMHASEVQPDPKLAEAWYRRGAELGDPRASSRLSSLEAMQQQ